MNSVQLVISKSKPSKPKPKPHLLPEKGGGGKKKEEWDNLKHKSGNFRMLLNVLMNRMDFRSLKIRVRQSTCTNTNNNNNTNNNKITK